MQIQFSNQAKKDLKKIPKSEANKISRKIFEMSQLPHSGKKLTGEFKTEYSFRAWPYRIIYEIYNKDQVVFVLRIEHRQGVYKT